MKIFFIAFYGTEIDDDDVINKAKPCLSYEFCMIIICCWNDSGIRTHSFSGFCVHAFLCSCGCRLVVVVVAQHTDKILFESRKQR